LALAAGGIAGLLNFSSAVAAFFVGLLITGEVADVIRQQLQPIRDVFAAIFFVFFGLQTDPSDIPSALLAGVVLVAITWATKVATVWFALGEGRDDGSRVDGSHIDGSPVDSAAAHQRWFCALRGGSVLSARGEFSVAIGALIVAFDAAPAHWQGTVATYVMLSAIVGPLLAKVFDARSKR
jgi:CPA2 family monovalent cation:H+ antiporter-2